jgi:DNA polymerase elongation subunit (family B)
MKFEYVTIDAVGRKEIVLVGRSLDDGKRYVFRIRDFFPYFYVPAEFAPMLKGNIDGLVAIEQSDKRSFDGKSLVKIVVDDRALVPKFRAKFPLTYEADIPFHKRAKIDMGIKAGFEIPDEAVLRGVSWKEVKGW